MKKGYLLLPILIGSLLSLTSCNEIQNSDLSIVESDTSSETSASTEVDTIKEDENLTYKIKDSQVTITGAVDYSVKDITVPKYIEDFKVTVIEFGAFEKCENLESISLPFIGGKIDGDETNRYLGYIFGDQLGSSNCYIQNSLTSVTVTGCYSIGNYAFYKCDYLNTINILKV